MKSVLLLLLSLCLAAQGQDRLVPGHEGGANGDHLTGWFTARGYELLDQFRRVEARSGVPVVAELPAAELERVVNTTQLVLVNEANRGLLTNKYGEVKDVRVVKDERSGLPVLLMDEANLRRIYESGRTDYRIVLHGYLMAAGKNDTNYLIASRVPNEHFPLALAPQLDGPTLADDRARLKVDITEAQEIYTRIANFLEFYAVEVVREKNLEQYGTIDGKVNGSLDGKGRALMLGNVPALVKGLVGLGSASLTVPFPLSPGLPLLPIDRSAGLLLEGLSGWGYGSLGITGSLAGELHGEFKGAGVQIHSDPHLFVVTAKHVANLRAGVDQLKALDAAFLEVERGSDKLEANQRHPEIAASRESLEAVLANDRIPTLEGISELEKAMRRFATLVRDADLIQARNIERADPIFQNAQQRALELKRWMSGKRLLIAVIGGEPLKISHTVQRSCDIDVTYTLTNDIANRRIRYSLSDFDRIQAQVAWREERACQDTDRPLGEADYARLMQPLPSLKLERGNYEVKAPILGFLDKKPYTRFSLVSLCERRSTWGIRNIAFNYCVDDGGWTAEKIRDNFRITKAASLTRNAKFQATFPTLEQLTDPTTVPVRERRLFF